ncbi:MAG: hypothetical protein KDA29_10795 [Phycisphaerales bacterium]|nr:hypothetical protein [Phycisphaerales bacterium]
MFRSAAPTLSQLLTLCTLAASSVAQPCSWEHVLTPVVENATASPFAIHARAADDIWIVGERTVGQFPFWEYHNYAAHFDGTQWTNVPVPSIDPLGDHNELWGVVSVSQDEAYAGGATKWMGSNQVQIFRWDGDEWELEALNVINDVGSIGAMGQAGDEIWAVGSRNSETIPPAASGIALALRRTDSGWVEEFVPPFAAFGRATNPLNAIDGVSADDAWAVGDARQVYTPGPSFAFTRYIVHWDGTQWTLDDSLPFLERSTFNDVEAIAHDDAWAVGYKSGNGSNQPMIVHYDGTGWSEIDLEPLPGAGGLLRGIAARSPDDIYAMGAFEDAGGNNQLLIYHFDGASWTNVSNSAAPTGGFGQQYMVADASPDGTIWGAGLYVRPDSGPLTQRLVCDAVCLADLTGDGELDFFDVSAFLNAYNAMSPVADFTGDGVYNFFDVSAFLNAFNAGCP